MTTLTPARHRITDPTTARLSAQARTVTVFGILYRVHALYLIATGAALVVTISVAIATRTPELSQPIAALCAAWLAVFATLTAIAAADLHLTRR